MHLPNHVQMGMWGVLLAIGVGWIVSGCIGEVIP